MLDQAFIAVNSWMQAGTGLAALGCFLWGMISAVFSPCHIAAIPLIIGYVAGQEMSVNPRCGVYYALSFTTGLFMMIAAVGIICSLVGRMLGEVGPYWTILVGAILLWVAVDMLGIVKCSLPTRVCKMKFRGLIGAFCLGLAYGILSGSCTFGFIAPILAVITTHERFMTGLLYIALFGLGHSIPIAIAGSSTAGMRKVLEHCSFCEGGVWVRKGAGVMIGLLGIYFILRPFFPSAS